MPLSTKRWTSKDYSNSLYKVLRNTPLFAKHKEIFITKFITRTIDMGQFDLYSICWALSLKLTTRTK